MEYNDISGNSPIPDLVNHTGYPTDKGEGSMWTTECAKTAFSYVDPSNNILQHSCDSTHGQSGSAMFDGDNNIRAVLTGGGDASGVNSALKAHRRPRSHE